MNRENFKHVLLLKNVTFANSNSIIQSNLTLLIHIDRNRNMNNHRYKYCTYNVYMYVNYKPWEIKMR